MYQRIHITGASGAGTTTLGRAISQAYGHIHLDTDDFFWLPTDPMFQAKRPRPERQRMLGQALDEGERWVLSGSLTDWGDMFISRFDLVIYVRTATDLRLKRLHQREYERFGSRILDGGDMCEEHKNFLAWAAGYDKGGMDIRSAAMHEAWLQKLSCPVIKLDGARPVEENLNIVFDNTNPWNADWYEVRNENTGGK